MSIQIEHFSSQESVLEVLSKIPFVPLALKYLEIAKSKGAISDPDLGFQKATDKLELIDTHLNWLRENRKGKDIGKFIKMLGDTHQYLHQSINYNIFANEAHTAVRDIPMKLRNLKGVDPEPLFINNNTLATNEPGGLFFDGEFDESLQQNLYTLNNAMLKSHVIVVSDIVKEQINEFEPDKVEARIQLLDQETPILIENARSRCLELCTLMENPANSTKLNYTIEMLRYFQQSNYPDLDNLTSEALTIEAVNDSLQITN